MLNYIKDNKLEIILVCIITLFAYILRFIALHNFGELWIDEIFSSYFAQKNSVIEVIKSLYIEDLHVPLYFVLLHYWIKIFGDGVTVMRLMGCLISTLTVPAVYFIVRNLFNSKFSAIMASLFIAISAFNIHYCVEVRFYGMSVLFALFSSYFYTKFIQSFSKKDITLYIISALLLLYTFNFSFMYIFCQFIIGLIYLVIKDRTNLIKYFITYLLVAILYLPAMLMILFGVIKYNTAILKFVRDIYFFDITWFETYFITVFTTKFDQFMMNDPLLNRYGLDQIFKLQMLFGVFLPVIFGFVGMFLGLSKSRLRNKNLFFFIVPALLLLFVQIIFVFNHFMALIYRYTVISTNLLLITAVLGFANSEKNRKLCITCLVIWLFLNLFSFLCPEKHSVLDRKILYTLNLESSVKSLDIKSNDIVLIPCNGMLFSKQVPYGKHFDINLYYAFYIGIRPQDIDFVFGKDLASILNRKYAKTYLYRYIVLNEPLLALKYNLNKEIFSKMQNGQKFIIITDEILTDLKNNQLFLQSSMDVYRRSAIGNTLMAKIITDMITFASEELTYKEHIELGKRFNIFVFEK